MNRTILALVALAVSAFPWAAGAAEAPALSLPIESVTPTGFHAP